MTFPGSRCKGKALGVNRLTSSTLVCREPIVRVCPSGLGTTQIPYGENQSNSNKREETLGSFRERWTCRGQHGKALAEPFARKIPETENKREKLPQLNLSNLLAWSFKP